MITTNGGSYNGPSAMWSTTELLVAVGRGDRSAWEEIVRRYGKLVSATVRSFRLQDADALDAVQMTWLRLAENAHQVHDPERLGGWLATTARHECLHILHQVKPTPHRCEMVPENIAGSSVGPEQHVIDADIARTVWALVAELSPRRRTLLRALFTDNPRPYAEVAHVTGIPPGGIGPTRARALRQLRSRLEQCGLGSAALR